MASISQPTGATITAIMPAHAGMTGGVLEITDTVIDADVTNNGALSIPTVEFEYMKTLLLANGLTWNALTTAEANSAQRALIYACWWKYLQQFEPNMMQVGKAEDCDPQITRRLAWVKGLITEALYEIGITDSKYCVNKYSDTPKLIKHCSD